METPQQWNPTQAVGGYKHTTDRAEELPVQVTHVETHLCKSLICGSSLKNRVWELPALSARKQATGSQEAKKLNMKVHPLSFLGFLALVPSHPY